MGPIGSPDRQFKSSWYKFLLWAAQNNRPHTLERCLLLLHAASLGDWNELHAFFLKEGFLLDLDPSPKDWSGIVAILLDEAIRKTSPDRVRVLLEHGVDPNMGVYEKMEWPPYGRSQAEGSGDRQNVARGQCGR
ncbi:uncharacterized protein H6S33_008247 [Morchella sextelata]|uniref:uncharacterized protein n=1 Tax=Morchella sextelata TaxID=1174677 RepID=UPI001D041530|nr:uncharacterized protein H6S33_008247 [Morchella sextelata]KAH0603243.1 hypothetical protein H6S33_008247 [Morchella sextelata]